MLTLYFGLTHGAWEIDLTYKNPQFLPDTIPALVEFFTECLKNLPGLQTHDPVTTNPRISLPHEVAKFGLVVLDFSSRGGSMYRGSCLYENAIHVSFVYTIRIEHAKRGEEAIVCALIKYGFMWEASWTISQSPWLND